MQWKKAKIIPVPKSSDDFRLVAILPFISKVFESIIKEQINKFLMHNNILNNFQSGFRKDHSCLTALANIVEDIRSE